MSLPEGLHLTLTPDQEPGIFDAQDVCHVIITDGGNGDPVEWQKNIIRRTCEGLGVTLAADELGQYMTIDEFCDWYAGDRAFQ